MDNNKLNSSADHMLFTLNPPIKASANSMIMALMTSKKRPSVRMVAGSVSSTITGRTKIFSSPTAIATQRALRYDSIVTPGSSLEMIRTAKALKIIFKMSFIGIGF